MIASLPMYDWPEVRDATDAWWRAIAARLGDVMPLSRIDDFPALWRSPELLLSQTCGYPLTHEFAGKLSLVATLHYAADGCAGPHYCSIVLARRPTPLSQFRGLTAAVNSPDSMSGMLALKLVFAPLARNGEFFGKVVWSGSHAASMGAVRDGRADVCAIDAVCVALARRYRPDLLEGLVEVARSPLVPGLPYVTVAGDASALRRALADCFADPALRSVRERLLLAGQSVLGLEDYRRITELERSMEMAGGLALR